MARPRALPQQNNKQNARALSLSFKPNLKKGRGGVVVVNSSFVELTSAVRYSRMAAE